jgi:beta-xylosidase
MSDWYYAVTSTFEYLPALPIYRSRDLASWAFMVDAAYTLRVVVPPPPWPRRRAMARTSTPAAIRSVAR